MNLIEFSDPSNCVNTQYAALSGTMIYRFLGNQEKNFVICGGKEYRCTHLNTYKQNGISHFYQLDPFISVLRVVGWYFQFYSKFK